MKALRTALVVGGLALVLGACSLFIPDQTLTDPLGIDGLPVTMSATAPTLLVPLQGTASTFSGPISGSFGDFTGSIPGWLGGPNGLQVPLNFDTTAMVFKSSGDVLPTSFTLTYVALQFTIGDSLSPPFVSPAAFTRTGQLLIFTQESGCTSTALSCQYAVAGGSDLGNTNLLDLGLSQSDLDTLWQILTNGTGPDSNTINGTLDVTVDTPLPTGTAIEVTLKVPEGTLSF